ncbi:MAG: hypothetical protein WA901_02070 [Phormidesmis sp.]
MKGRQETTKNDPAADATRALVERQREEIVHSYLPAISQQFYCLIRRNLYEKTNVRIVNNADTYSL